MKDQISYLGATLGTLIGILTVLIIVNTVMMMKHGSDSKGSVDKLTREVSSLDSVANNIFGNLVKTKQLDQSVVEDSSLFNSLKAKVEDTLKNTVLEDSLNEFVDQITVGIKEWLMNNLFKKK